MTKYNSIDANSVIENPNLVALPFGDTNNKKDAPLPLAQSKALQIKLYHLIRQKCYPAISSFVLSHCGSIDDVADIVQDTWEWLILLETDDFCRRLRCPSYSYVIATAKNIWRKELSYRKQYIHIDGDIDQRFLAESDNLQTSTKNLQYILFRKCLFKMDYDSRQIIRFLIKGIPTKVAAAKLDCTIETYKKRKARTLKKLTGYIYNDPEYCRLNEVSIF